LLNIAIAAQFHGRDAWLDQVVVDDIASGSLWRRKRAIVLRELTSSPNISTLVWPEEKLETSWGILEARMALWKNNGALALHWWRQFASATTPLAAFSAWELFLHCADRRAYSWMENELRLAETGSELDRLRRLHMASNLDRLESALRKRESEAPKFDDKLFGVDEPRSWLQLDGLTFS
jgi:hypothetical protein